GSIFSPESLGANRLICEGAAPIVSEEDLEMRISLDFGAVRLMVPGQRRDLGRILSALVAQPMRPDDLANRLGEPALNVLVALSDYEATGLVVRLPDGRYAPSRDCLLSR
ncbi:MAG: DNA-processing protein DprA, partial [Atopobiaceae bacterium]|nr:DNA-processing protein DprA [Atopobiaceae bacterium]